MVHATKLISTAQTATSFIPQHYSDDDWVDRLNHRYTVIIMVLFSIVVSTKQYVGDPIYCWVPAEYNAFWSEYAQKICWVSNTYYLPKNENMPRTESERKAKEIGYYQWVPFILLTQAFLFYVPGMLWRGFNDKSGVSINNIVEAGQLYHSAVKFEERDKIVRYITKYLDQYLESQRELGNGRCVKLKEFLAKTCCLFCGKKYGNYVICLYLIIKIFYVSNAIGQLFLLNTFLGTDYNLYGLDVIWALTRGEEFTSPHRFPRVTMCEFEIRSIAPARPKHEVMQCVLPINLFTEKIYIFIWFWLVFVSTCTAMSLVGWAWRSAFHFDRLMSVKKHLKLTHRLQRDADKKLCREFVNKFLRQDGVFILRLLGKNTSDLIVTEVVTSLWDNYKDFKPLRIRQKEMV